MASGLPIPLPPRTPTPPPDNNLASPAENISMGYQQQGSLDPASLSPLTDTFPSSGSSGIFFSPLAARGINAYQFVPIDASWNSYRRPSLDVPSPFNFKPTTLAKTPVLKSVYISFLSGNSGNYANVRGYDRTSDSAVGTNTNTAAYLTRYSLNHLQGHPWLFQIRCQSQRLKNTARACPETKRLGSGGVYAIWQWQDTHYGALMVPWP